LSKGTYEISVEGVTSWVTIGKNEWLLSLALGPSVRELGGVPVDLIEEMGKMDPTLRAVSVGGKCRVGLVVCEPTTSLFIWVVAGWEVDISSQR
jgi:hypothetical protein